MRLPVLVSAQLGDRARLEPGRAVAAFLDPRVSSLAVGVADSRQAPHTTMTRSPSPLSVVLLATTFAGLLAAVVWFNFRHDELPEMGSARQQVTRETKVSPSSVPALPVRSLGSGLPEKGEWRGKPVMADLNGDRKLDFVTSIRRFDKMRIADGIHVYLGDGKGGWASSDSGLSDEMGYGGADAGDVNGDGRPDVVYSGHDMPPRVFANFLGQSGHDEWVGMDSVPGFEQISCSDVALGDFDLDGDLDLAVMGFFPKTGGLYVLTNNGSGEFDSKTDLLTHQFYGAIVRFVDLDADGRVELIAATSVGAKAWWFENGAWVDRSAGLPTTTEVGDISGIVRGIDARDIDGDGQCELAVSCLPTTGHPAIRVFRRAGESWSSWGRGLPSGESFFDVVFARLHGGSTGLFLAGQHGVVAVRCRSDGECETLGRIDRTAGVLNVGSGDVDGDEVDEVLVVGQKGLCVYAIDLPTVSSEQPNK